MNLTVIGTIYVDIKGFPVGDFVPAGRNVGRIEQFHGGVGRNIAEDVNALDISTSFISLVDDSGIGADVVRHLSEIGMNTSYIRATKDGMGTWLAVFDSEGEVCANVSNRPNLLPIVSILEEEGDAIFASSAGILLEIDIDEEIVEKTMSLAKKYGVPVYAVISNMTIARKRLPYIKDCACFICNRQEAGILFEREVERLSTSEMLELLKTKRAALGMESMVVTLDADGAIYTSVNGECGQVPAETVKVVDTTGAGDSFFAGVSAELAAGKTLKEACLLGTHMASRVICSQQNVYLP